MGAEIPPAPKKPVKPVCSHPFRPRPEERDYGTLVECVSCGTWFKRTLDHSADIMLGAVSMARWSKVHWWHFKDMKRINEFNKERIKNG